MNSHLLTYLALRLTPIPLKPGNKQPLVRWGRDWNPSWQEVKEWSNQPEINIGIRCGKELAVLDFDEVAAALTGYLKHQAHK
jgi:hypothetical protein